MADYYSIIAKAVDALDGNTKDARRGLYERARAALIAEIRRADPALNQSDILIARMSLEEAIGKVEAEARRDRRAHRPIAAPGRGEAPSDYSSGETDSGKAATIGYPKSWPVRRARTANGEMIRTSRRRESSGGIASTGQRKF
jgi:hypothetical protein